MTTGPAVVNTAVMAGCLPDCFPIALAAAGAISTARPGLVDESSMATPSKYTSCHAENGSAER